MGRHGTLGEFEHLVMLAVLRHPEGVYSASIGREIKERADRRVSRGALYSALERLEQKGFVSWTLESAGPDCGGHPRRLFEVTAPGRVALGDYRRAIQNLSVGIEEL